MQDDHPVLPRHGSPRLSRQPERAIDFGLALGKDYPFTPRVKDTGGIAKKDRITHKIEIATA